MPARPELLEERRLRLHGRHQRGHHVDHPAAEPAVGGGHLRPGRRSATLGSRPSGRLSARGSSPTSTGLPRRRTAASSRSAKGNTILLSSEGEWKLFEGVRELIAVGVASIPAIVAFFEGIGEYPRWWRWLGWKPTDLRGNMRERIRFTPFSAPFHDSLLRPRLAANRLDPLGPSRGAVRGARTAGAAGAGAGAAARPHPLEQHGRPDLRDCLRLFRRPAARRDADAGHALAHDGRSIGADVSRRAAAVVPRARLAPRRGHDRHGPGRFRGRGDRRAFIASPGPPNSTG